MKLLYALLLAAGAAPCLAQTPADSTRSRQRAVRWYLAPSAGVAYTHLRLREPAGSAANLFERSYLDGQDVDRGPRLLLGAQSGLVAARGHLALHTEHQLRRFGGYEQTFETGHPDFPQKTFYARGAALSSVLSLRYLLPVRGWQAFAGLGLSRLTLLGLRAGSYYNGVSYREARGFALPTDGQFLKQWGRGEGSSRRAGGLYFEAGLARGRWSLTWSYRHTWAGSGSDDTAVALFRADRQTGEPVGILAGLQYSLRPVAFCWTAAYRLNR